MSIPITTRSGKGAPLTQTEMDTNLTNLARSATESQEGSIEIATQAEVDALADATKAIPPAYLSSAVLSVISSATGGLSQNLADPGSDESLTGLQLRWGTTSSRTTEGSVTVNFDSPFPTACFGVVATTITAAGNFSFVGVRVDSGSVTTSGCSLQFQSTSSSLGASCTAFYIAIGH